MMFNATAATSKSVCSAAPLARDLREKAEMAAAKSQWTAAEWLAYWATWTEAEWKAYYSAQGTWAQEWWLVGTESAEDAMQTEEPTEEPQEKPQPAEGTDDMQI